MFSGVPQLPRVPLTPSFPSAGVRNIHPISVVLGSGTATPFLWSWGQKLLGRMWCSVHHTAIPQNLRGYCRAHRVSGATSGGGTGGFFSSCSLGEFSQLTDNCAKGRPSKAQGTMTPHVGFAPFWLSDCSQRWAVTPWNGVDGVRRVLALVPATSRLPVLSYRLTCRTGEKKPKTPLGQYSLCLQTGCKTTGIFASAD